MYGQSALGVSPHAEGVPISGVHYYRASSTVPAAEAGLRAGDGGVSIGRAGFANVEGVVLNERTSEADTLGIVVYQGGDWRRVYWDSVTLSWKIRKGLNLTMLSASPGVWVFLEGGAVGAWGQRVHASPIDGRLYAGYADGLEPTRWAVGKPIGVGGLSLITTWNTPNG